MRTATPTTREERRQRVRARVTYFACVRSEAFGKMWLACTECRAEILFRSDKERIFYFDGSEDRGSVFTGFAEGACDLRGGAGMNITALPEVKMFRCG